MSRWVMGSDMPPALADARQVVQICALKANALSRGSARPQPSLWAAPALLPHQNTRPASLQPRYPIETLAPLVYSLANSGSEGENTKNISPPRPHLADVAPRA